VKKSKPDNTLFLALLLAICLATAIVHWPSLAAKARCYDDNQYMTDNILVRHPSLTSAWRFLTEVLNPSTVHGYYQPLAMISLMVDSAMGGQPDNVEPFHRTSLALHILSTALVAILLYLLFGHAWVACGVAMLFGLHPLAVEPVAWVGERKTVLAAFFSFCCLVAYVRYVQESRWPRYMLVVLLYVFALMSKPTSTLLPLVLLLLDFWPLKRFGRKSILEKIPLFVIGGISAVITVLSQANTATVSMPKEYGLWRVPLVFGYDVAFYLQKMVWPVGLAPHYAFPQSLSLSNITVLMYAVCSLVLLVLLAVLLRWSRAPLTGWLIFFLMVLPTMQALQFSDVIASDKFAYLPSIGMLLVLAWVLTRIWGDEDKLRLTRKRAIIIVCILAVAGAESLATINQLGYWRDTVTLYERMVKISPWSVSPRDNMAVALAMRGDLDRAMEELKTALALDPNAPQTIDAMGTILANKGQPEKALQWHMKAVSINPLMHGPQYNVAVTLMKLGKTQEAIPYCRRALALRPQWPEAHMQLGILLDRTGDEAQAVAELSKAVELEPELLRAHLELAEIHVRQGKWDAAATQYLSCVELQPDYDNLNNLGSALAEAGRLPEAERYYRQAVMIKPDAAMAYCNLAVTLAKQGRVDEAMDFVKKALQVEPDNEQARMYLRMLTNGGQNAQKK
jgi:tetratricopeptide (TPR) repeat protein